MMMNRFFCAVLSFILLSIFSAQYVQAYSLIDLSDPAASSLATTLQGVARDNWLGDSLQLADLNDDATLDLALGVYRFNGPSGDAAGRVYVIFGPVSTVTETVDLSKTTSDYLIIDGDRPGDLFGYSVTSGDINNDGVPDLVVGAPLASTATLSRCGKVYVFLGKAGERVVNGSPGTFKASDEADLIIYGADVDDNIGIELMAADFAREATGNLAIDDLIIAAPFGNAANELKNRVYVFAGATDVTKEKTFSIKNRYTFLIQNAPFQDVTNLNNTGLAFGQVTTTNGVLDPTPCLVLGMKGADEGVGSLTGAVLALAARPFEATATMASRVIDLKKEKPAFKILGPYGGAKAGEVVRIADIDGDATPELIIGCSGADPEKVTGAALSKYPYKEFWGAAYILYGGVPNGSSFALDQLGPTGPVPSQVYTALAGVGGYDVATATIPVGKGTETVLAVSSCVASSTPEKLDMAGRIYLFYASSLKGVVKWDVYTKPADVTISGAAKNDQFGRALTFGNIYSNGTAAVVVGSSFSDVTISGETNPRYDAGVVYVLPVSILSPVSGDMTNDSVIDYKDVFNQSAFWRGKPYWNLLQDWHENK